MNALQRAESDLQRGDHWLARCRIESYLQTKGYDAELLAKAGRIALEMHDKYNAGRLWLTSTAEGEDVEEAVATFLRHAGTDPVQVLRQLPRFARLVPLDSYPPVVQDRLRRLGLDGALLASVFPGRMEPSPTSWSDRVKLVLVAAVVLGFVGSCGVGANTIRSWLFGGD